MYLWKIYVKFEREIKILWNPMWLHLYRLGKYAFKIPSKEPKMTSDISEQGGDLLDEQEAMFFG